MNYWFDIVIFFVQLNSLRYNLQLGAGAHTCNPSYLGD
jgi:hypothetical protein